MGGADSPAQIPSANGLSPGIVILKDSQRGQQYGFAFPGMKNVSKPTPHLTCADSILSVNRRVETEVHNPFVAGSRPGRPTGRGVSGAA